MMRSDVRVAQKFGQATRHPLRQAPRIHEDQRRAMLIDQGREAAMDLLPDLHRHHRFQRRVGQLDRKVTVTPMARVDDGDV